MPFVPSPDNVSRRWLLRGVGAATAVAPLGLAAPSVFASNRFGVFPSEILPSPICKASASVPVTVVTGPPRKLKLTWNASAICTAGVPVAAATGPRSAASGHQGQ